MFYNKVEVKAIILAVYNIESLGLNSSRILLKSIVWLCKQYETTKENLYLEKAMWHIYAYLELGYPYEAGEREFNIVLKYLQLNRADIFSTREWAYKKIALTKANVNRLLGKWNPYFQSMKINDAVADIIKKVRDKEYGKYIYHCGKAIEEGEENTLWEKTFILYVTKDEAILQDMNKSKYYMLKEIQHD